jgi:UDP-N-acetylmuramate: L-alanyl-gamma-D-glutamyl-meso-diaminopimelate ligase
VFQADFARALSAADRVIVPAVFRSALPDSERLSSEQLVSDLKAGGVDARFIPKTEDIVAAVARDSREGDLVLIMSNGGFDDIHRKLLDALGAR